MNYKRFLEDFGETLKKAEEIVEEVNNDPNNKYNFHLHYQPNNNHS